MTESAYEAQLRRQLHEARQEIVGLRADRARLEDEVGPLRQRLAEATARAELAERQAAERLPLICSDERHQAKVAWLEAQLAELHEGEAATDDDPNVTSAPLWLRRFNRATSQQRLAMAELIIDAWPELDNCRFNHSQLSEAMQWHRAREARYRLAWKSARHRATTAEAILTTLYASVVDGLPGSVEVKP